MKCAPPSLRLELLIEQTPLRYSVMPTGRTPLGWGVFDHWKDRPRTSVFVDSDFHSRFHDYVDAVKQCRRLNRSEGKTA